MSFDSIRTRDQAGARGNPLGLPGVRRSPAWLIRMGGVLLVISATGLTGCKGPVGADPVAPVRVHRQTHGSVIRDSEPSPETLQVLRRLDQVQRFHDEPDATLRFIHQQAMKSSERGLLFVLAELNHLTGERVRHGVKPWDPRDPRDYYLASAVYAWLFLFGEADGPLPGAFDQRFRAACDLYNHGLARGLTKGDGTNNVAVLAGGSRSLSMGRLEMDFNHQDFPWPLEDFENFVSSQHLLVRGLSVRNRQPGLGAPLVGVTRRDPRTQLSRCIPATVLLRVESGLPELAQGRCRASLELYSAFNTTQVQVGARPVPLETDTTASLAYALNQSSLWQLGMLQFFSFEEKIPSDVYLNQPYQPGKIPVVLVHGTFSSPIWWAEMFNTLAADPEVQQRYQFWWFIYNSGNPTLYSAVKLRDSLTAKLQALDPENKDPALRQMVVVGHSQGGLLTKLTATDTGDHLLQALLKTNRLGNLNLNKIQQERVRKYLCLEALPFVKRVVFISTPHRGSYMAGNFASRIARKLVSLPSRLIVHPQEFARLTEKLDIPKELKGTPTSIQSMSPKNPLQLALADIPLVPGVKGHSIIAVRGDGPIESGKDGLVAYDSAHVNYVESEFIVRGFHSCQSLPPTIEEVRRILHEHLLAQPASAAKPPAPN